MLTAVQGIIAAGTVAYLTQGTLGGEKAKNPWENIALASNHLFLIVGAALTESSIKVPYFSTLSTAVFVFTPVVLLSNLARKEGDSSARYKTITANFSRFYYTASIASATVLLALGHTGFGLGFLTVLALDGLARRMEVARLIQELVGLGAIVTAGITFASYASRLQTWEGRSVMIIVAAEIFLPKLSELLPDDSGSSSSSSNGTFRSNLDSHDDDDWYDKTNHENSYRTSYLPVSDKAPASSSSSGSESPLLRRLQDATPPLPHAL